MNYQINTQAQVAPPPVALEVPTKANDLAVALTNLADLVGVLDDRLGSVMRPQSPEPDSTMKAVEQQGCAVAESFYQCQKTVNLISHRVQGLINRLEI